MILKYLKPGNTNGLPSEKKYYNRYEAPNNIFQIYFSLQITSWSNNVNNKIK